MANDLLPVIEIFGPTIQGEGPLVGQLTHFIRFGGCGYKCSWCDSMHAVDPDQIKANAKYMSAGDIAKTVQLLGDAKNVAQYVTISGGDPLMWDLSSLVLLLKYSKYKISIETQGQFFKNWLPYCDNIVVSPKPPSSEMQGKIDHDVLRKYVQQLHISKPSDGADTQLSFKVVVFNELDFDWAMEIHSMYPEVPFFLSVGTQVPDLASDEIHDIAGEVLADYEALINMANSKKLAGDIRILAQTHVLLYGHAKGV